MKGRRILLGISGGIAAYKIAFLIRLLKKSGAEVRCIMTPASCDFISPVVVSALSENPVGIEFWNKGDGTWTNHVEYGLWAEVFLIAPLTANTLSKMAAGSCDNLLLATYLSMREKTIVAPSMDLDMYAHSATVRNLEQIRKDGVEVIPAESGELASGLQGEGRMAEPETLFNVLATHFGSSVTSGNELNGRKVLITAGPTYEAIDPVRFIGNHSSGKMGYELARQALRSGAEVVLISGPTVEKLSDPGLNLIRVTTADEMFRAVRENWTSCDTGIFAAAVADYKPKERESQKIKKSADEMQITLVKNPDILGWAGENRKDDQMLVGFALESENAMENAKAKLRSKGLDAIILNSLEHEGAGFSSDTNKITILDKYNNSVHFELKAKSEVAADIVKYISKLGS